MSTPGIRTLARAAVARTMRYRCTIERAIETGRDPLNQPTRAWVDHLVDLPCTLWHTGGPGEQVGPPVQAVIATWQLALPHGADVTEADRVREVRDADGTQLNTQPIGIRQVVRRETHTLLQLDEVR